MMQTVLHEITPLTESDCFMLFSRRKERFDFPLHAHPEYELNLIRGAGGARRVIGDHEGEIGDMELVLVGSNLQHGWFNYRCTSRNISEITVQFHHDFLDAGFLKRNQLNFIRRMFDDCSRGILFSEDITREVASRIAGLDQKQGFQSVLELMSILHDLSISRDMRMLSVTHPLQREGSFFNSNGSVQRTLRYLQEHYSRQLSLKELAEVAGMSGSAFGKFFKKATGYSFKEILSEVRLGNAARMLVDTTRSINEISYECGFNNLSNFNRQFKKEKRCTPKEYRDRFSSTRIFV